jgi:SAM-dependent methyltransferase
VSETNDDLDNVIAEAEAAPIDGWDFSWLDGRATEERPVWGYSRLAASHVAQGVDAVLDIQTGGGEVFEEILTRSGRMPARVEATESWPPNVRRAATRLGALGVTVSQAPDGGDLPFADSTFDLVLSRHPTRWSWPEIARVLTPGGTHLAQHVGPGSNHELTEFFLGPTEISEGRSPERAVAGATSRGLDVRDLRHQPIRLEFFDVGAVVYFLRMVVWTVPGFNVERYRERLADLHRHINAHGSFISHAQRFLIEAVRRSDA